MIVIQVMRIIFLLLSSLAFAQNQKSIILAADVWCPLNCDPNSENKGYAIDIAKEIFEKYGIEIIYKNTSWARAIEESRKGNFSGIIGALRSDAPDFIFPKESIAKQQDCFYGKPNQTWHYSGTSSLLGKKIGVVKHYTYATDEINHLSEKPEGKNIFIEVSGDNPLQMNSRKIFSNRIDFLIENPLIVNYVQKKEPWAKDLKNYGCGDTKDIFIAFSPNLPVAKAYSNLFSKIINEMRANGKLEKILNKYDIKDWK